jgi:hypothetical protein
LPLLKIRYRKMMIRIIKETPRIIPGNVPLSIRAMTPRNMMAFLGKPALDLSIVAS